MFLTNEDGRERERKNWKKERMKERTTRAEITRVSVFSAVHGVVVFSVSVSVLLGRLKKQNTRERERGREGASETGMRDVQGGGKGSFKVSGMAGWLSSRGGWLGLGPGVPEPSAAVSSFFAPVLFVF